MRKLDEGEYSALILAAAGLERMERQNKAFVGRLTELLEPKDCLYAVGQVTFNPRLSDINLYFQGALAIEIMSEDSETAKLLECLNHEESSLRVVAERAFMKRLMGGCSAPVAVESIIDHDSFTLTGAVFSLDGSESIFETEKITFSKKQKSSEIPSEFTGIIAAGVDPVKMMAAYQLGMSVAGTLLGKGAKRILDEAKAQNDNPLPSQCPCPAAKALTKSLLT